MKETVDYFKQQLVEAKDVARLQWKSFIAALFVVAAVYVGSITLSPGWGTYFIAFPAALLLAVVSLVRLNSIGPECMGLSWQIRRIGLILTGTGSVMLLSTPFLSDPLFPTWRALVIIHGVAWAWLTTPDQPPFWKYWDGSYIQHPVPRPPLARIVGRITGAHSTDELRERMNKNPPDEGGN